MDFSILSQNVLFQGIDPQEIPALLDALGSRHISLRKGQELIRRGDEVTCVYILLSGSAHAVRTDYAGHNFIYTHLEPGSIFGDMLAAGKGKRSLATIVALGPSTAVSIPFQRLLSPPQTQGGAQVLLLQNLVAMYSEKYFSLLGRVDCLSAATLREKILRYLTNEAKRLGSSTFQIPFDRAALAAYLGADRSALSRELSRMKRDGLIDYYKNSFKILKTRL